MEDLTTKPSHGYTREDVARFWSKVSETEGCWYWSSAVNQDGYGKFSICRAGKNIHLTAHRVSYEIANGPIPPGAFICHRCDIRHCVNPGHLFVGDALANNRDAAQKGRSTKGEDINTAKLDASKVVEIRQKYAEGKATQTQLAEAYGITQGNVGMIVRRATWKHL